MTRVTRLPGAPDAVTATITYEPTYNQVASVTDPLGHASGFAYDSSGDANILNGGLNEVFTRTDSTGTWSRLADGLGSSISLADTSGINQTDYTYGAFGQTANAGAPNGNSSQYTGADNDGVDLQYSRARYYSSTLQRFISENPIEFAGGDMNLYGYVGNSPTNFTDPMGRQFRSDRDRPGDKEWADGLRKQMDSWPPPNSGRKDCGCDDGSSTSPFLIAGTCVVAGGGPEDPVADMIAAGYLLTALAAAASAPAIPKCQPKGIPFPLPPPPIGNDREKRCDQQYYGVDIPTCNGISRARGPAAGERCYASAAQRYAACLAGQPLPPLDTWNN